MMTVFAKFFILTICKLKSKVCNLLVASVLWNLMKCLVAIDGIIDDDSFQKNDDNDSRKKDGLTLLEVSYEL